MTDYIEQTRFHIHFPSRPGSPKAKDVECATHAYTNHSRKIKITHKNKNLKKFLKRWHSMYQKQVIAGRWWHTPVIPALWEAEAGGFLSSRPAWSTEWVPGQPGLYRKTLSPRNQNPKKQKTKKQQQQRFIYCIYVSTVAVFRHTRRGHQILL